MKIHAATPALALLGAALAFAACGDDSETGGGDGGEPVELTLMTEADLFPGFELDSGLLPDGSPVRASFTVSATGKATAAATCAVSGSKSKPVLTGLPDGGTIVIDGGFAMRGRLVVDDVPGIDPFDGEIPGLENVEIVIAGEEMFDPFAIDQQVSAIAEVPEADLPAIPLGSVPGELQLHVGEGSFVEIGWSGTCAGIDSERATYDGTFVRGGRLIIEPKIVIDVLIDTIEYEIPPIEIDLALGASDASASAEVTKLGAAPPKGEKVSTACTDPGGGGGGDAVAASTGAGGGGGGQGGASGGSTVTTGALVGSSSSGLGVTTGGGGTSCDIPDDCGGFPCVDDVCSDGFCDSGLSYGDEGLDACITGSCCEQVDACTFDGADPSGCYECLTEGGGARCDGFFTCVETACIGTGVCDSGVRGGATIAQDECLGEACCAEFNACTQDGVDPGTCADCFEAGGGYFCDAAITCAESSGCLD